MSAVTGPDNVIALAPYRAARAARLERRPTMPYVLWYPGLGFVRPAAGVANSGPGKRSMHGPESA